MMFFSFLLYHLDLNAIVVDQTSQILQTVTVMEIKIRLHSSYVHCGDYATFKPIKK